MANRLPNGVKEYNAGSEKSNKWAYRHRKDLGPLSREYYMQDIDAFFGNIKFIKNTTNKLFAEYVPGMKNNQNIISKFGIVSFFDIKETESAMNYNFNENNNRISLSFYLYLAKIISEYQKIEPKFFYVVGIDSPWKLIEVNIYTGEKTGRSAIIKAGENWQPIWESLGLNKLRTSLKKWLKDNGW